MVAVATEQLEFIDILSKRVLSLLPNRTGHSIAEVELNSQFIITKNIINENQKKHPQIVSYILLSFVKSLEILNRESNYSKLRERDEKSLSSTLIICKLLSDILMSHWNREKVMCNLYLSDLSSNYSSYSYFDRPHQIETTVFKQIIETLITLLSPGVVRNVLDIVKGPRKAEESDVHSTKHSEVISNIVDEIDNNIALILRYIGSSNPMDYYQFLCSKIFKYIQEEDFVPIPTLQKYSPLIKFVFYVEENARDYARDYFALLKFIKSNTWRKVILVFATTSIQDQSFSRPVDYNTNLTDDDPDFQAECKRLYDEATVVFDDFVSNTCSSFVATWMLMLCLEDFNEFRELKKIGKSESKRLWESNKRIAYLNTILANISKGENLESFDTVMKILHLGARLKALGLKKHPILLFSTETVDFVFENLMVFAANQANFTDDNDILKYDNVCINFYAAALVLDPEKYTEIFTQKLAVCKDNIKEVKLLVKILKSLSELKIATNVFNKLMEKLSYTLKSMIFGSVKILKHYEVIQSSQRTPVNPQSSAGSVNLDSWSIDSSQAAGSFDVSNMQTTSLDHYVYDMGSIYKGDSNEALSRAISHHSHPSQPLQLICHTEEMLADLFEIFVQASQLYFNDYELMKDSNLESKPREEVLASIVQYSQEVTVPLHCAFKFESISKTSHLFDAACALAINLVEKDSAVAQNYTTLSTFSNYTVSNLIVQSICEACLLFSLTNSKFQACFWMINKFLQCRDEFKHIIDSNSILSNPATRKHIDFGTGAGHAIEKVLLLSLCTHDIEFYNSAKTTMRWYCDECRKRSNFYKPEEDIDENLADTFEKVYKDESVFTGFVSLHKRFRSILRDANPTNSLYLVWLLINYRWLEMLENKSKLNEENLVFRHFTGFLVSTSGCFLLERFAGNDPDQKARAYSAVSEFFDKCLQMLTSPDLVIRVVIKDALSNESHACVYKMLATKFISIETNYIDKKIVNAESILFFEQILVISTSMITIRNDGDFVLVAALPEICQLFMKFLNMVENKADVLRLKLRFCKLAEGIETDKKRSGVSGAFKLRNFYAKASCEWLEQAIFYDGEDSDCSCEDQKDLEITYLNIDLAAQSSKTLVLQLEEIVLEVPEGIKDNEIKKYKDLAFGNYFSLFYKIIQKYTNMDLSTSKSKYKLSSILDNVLKCISNILQYDVDIGMQFVLPLSYHSNNKIRSIFLNVFSNMLASRELMSNKEEFSEEVIQEFSSLTGVYGAIAEVASSSEYNLLASSLFGIFSYTQKLDNLFKILVKDEINNVTRSTDIFRRNSTLTRLLSNFATNHGEEYLSTTLKPFIEELVEKDITVEVERAADIHDTDIYIEYFTKLVDLIVGSIKSIPPSFKFICAEIYNCVKLKFEEASLIAVGSFLFLRFLCPAIISPETFFKIEVSNPKVKRTLMQLVKIIQNMANGSLSSLKWPGLTSKMEELNDLNKKISIFLRDVSTDDILEYPFQITREKPIPELRYLHKFVYHFYADIKVHYVLNDPNSGAALAARIKEVRLLDKIAKELGQPKPSVQLQIRTPLKNFDANNNGRDQFNDFMTKMSMRYVEKANNFSLVHNSIFADGTPVIVLNLKYLKLVDDDCDYLVYKFFETASQIWENKFYVVFDFTEFRYTTEIAMSYSEKIRAYSPEPMYQNCMRIYYYNIPRSQYEAVVGILYKLRFDTMFINAQSYAYSQVDSPEIVNNLCLEPSTTAISKDTRVIFNNVKIYSSITGSEHAVSLRIGRKWIQICSQNSVEFQASFFITRSFVPIDIYRLSDISKCEISHTTQNNDEFTIYLNSGDHVILRSNERQEILRFLYFTTSRLSKNTNFELEGDAEVGKHYMHWFARLYNIVFQGLLSDNEQVKSSSALLFGSLSSYFNIDFGIKTSHSTFIQFPANSLDFVNQVSLYLSQNFPTMTYRFFKAYFDSYDKITPENKLASIVYIAPWIRNIYSHVCLDQSGGLEKVAEIIRQLCRISALNKENISIVNDYIWKKLFLETRLLKVLIDEVISFTIDSKNDSPTNWSFIIAIIHPSIEVCGEIISRLLNCVTSINKDDSTIALQSKLFEIRILIKVCISLFFNSYDLSKLYLGDIFFLISLFIDNNLFDDLQKLCVNMIQSFLHKPNLKPQEQAVIDLTIQYFSDQRAKMLFGLTRDIVASTSDPVQIYNKILNFEVLCDYLNDFMLYMGDLDNDKYKWRMNWSSNSIDIAFSHNSIFQGRSILIVGILSKNGVNDLIAYKLIKLISKGEHKSLDYITSVTFAMARILQGLSPNSPLLSIMVWPMLGFCLINVSVLYQPSALCLINTIIKLSEFMPDFTDRIFEQRQLIEPLMSYFEMSQNLKITKENFETYVLFVLTQGLRVSQFKHASLSYLKKYFKAIAPMHQKLKEDLVKGADDYLSYLLFIYLSTDDNEFLAYLSEVGLHTDLIEDKNDTFPSIITDYLELGSISSKLAFLQAAFFYVSKSIDSLFSSRFLRLYTHLFKSEREISRLVYHIIKPALSDSLINNINFEVIDIIAYLQVAITTSDYSAEYYQEMADNILEEFNVQLLRDIKKMNFLEAIPTDDGIEVSLGENIRKLQVMGYRCACLYVEGSRLED
ncbi:ras GTPase activating protein RasGAP/neurofibromin [Suhomyces tanzawaensis NRRL Y-17324]|uniref:Ras GTPase activating protein RasGAP/neurofibromin n=1 Tax=Suhomyces tanzawaensis NRRL Y-17324 TaxID=984487 RepID=A0A1E4SFE9_9ASCO|nr:ras GTPase activating protein RasGAP/neurofibromin [Suhomyces tanzawaensis NRRL Y-17324]ODV78244.1 ras GTPase activating protein RasGAP/neurofibromin [Suhomyces tanzawaensis NRRL Y-17324]